MERFDDNDSEDERELDEQKNKKENDKKIDGNPSFSQSIINKQENTGIREKVNMAGQSNNPSFNIIGQNNNGLHNLDNNNDNSSFVPQESNNQNIQVNNFGNGVNSNNNQINYNQNYNVQNNNIANQAGIPSNNSNNKINNFNNQYLNNNYNNNNLNNNNMNNNIANRNNMNYLGNQNFNQVQVINQNNNLNNYQNNNNNNYNNPVNNNQNNQNQMSNRRQYPFSNIKNPIKTLLTTLGKTEYLNSTLYLIGSIKVLCEFFYIPNQNNDFVNNISKVPLSFIIHRLFLHLYPSSGNETSYKPDAIKRYLSDINCVYKSEKKRNPNELFSFILDTLHNELKNLHNELKKQPKAAMENPYDVFNRNNVINTGIKNFQNCDMSKISEHFNWFEIKATKCTQCNKIMYSFNTYHMLELDILNTSLAFKNRNSITIYDCLTYYRNIKSNLKAYCKSCNKNTIVDCGLQIFSNPNIFVFSLNRGLINGSVDDRLADVKFQLDEKIDLNNFVENKQTNKQYELRGIISISHRLEDNYVSFCKSPVDNNWYLYDSENVQLTNMNYILSEHNMIIEANYIPCILVYQSI